MFDQKPARDLREPLLDPGMRQMLELERRIHLVARLPHPEKLSAAFNAFIKVKQDTGQPIEDFHVARLLQTFNALEEDDNKSLPAGKQWWLHFNDMRRALLVLASAPEEKITKLHNGFARRLYERMSQDTSQISEESSDPQERFAALERLIRILSLTGEAKEARVMLTEYLSGHAQGTAIEDAMAGSWPQIVAGFAREKEESEILRTLEIMQERQIPISTQTRTVLAIHYARSDNVKETKNWFTPRMLSIKREDKRVWMNTSEAYRTLLEFCLRNQEMEWAQQIFGETDQNWKRSAILQAAASIGKSVDDIDRMLDVMAKHEGESALDISVFNSLIEYAAKRNDAYTAERYLALAQKWGVEPDSQTYIHQISYRLDAGDYSGAQAAYKILRQLDINEQEDWEVMNKMLQALTKTPGVSSETIMGLVKDLSARKRLFPAPTVAALCTYHLQRDEYFELVDLLQTYAYQYNVADRLMLRDLLADVVLDPEQDTARAWDTYMIFHQVFDLETGRDIRTAVMTAMFERRRPDLATHVFTRMARHSRADTRPDHATYVATLSGIYQTAEPEALEVVHNILKLDTEVEPSTQLRTALMLAYTACGAPWRALEFWEQISTSDEGPSYSSLHAVMRACERQPFGYRTANAVWDRLIRSDVEIDGKLFASYVGVLSGNRMFEECGTLIGQMPQTTGQEVDAFTVGTFFNCALGVTYQDQIAIWIQDNFPKIWEELEARGWEEDEQGFKTIRGIDRSLLP